MQLARKAAKMDRTTAWAVQPTSDCSLSVTAWLLTSTTTFLQVTAWVLSATKVAE